MKKIFFALVVSSFLFIQAYAEEVVLTADEILIEQIRSKIAEGVPTIKIFLSEKGECSEILTQKVIQKWYLPLIENIAQPIEARAEVYETQSAPLKEEIKAIKEEMADLEEKVVDKKEEFLDNLGITTDYQKIVDEIKLIQADILTKRGELNVKTKELENIADHYNTFAYLSRVEVTAMFESGIMKNCKEWYGKVELSERKTLDVQKYDMTDQIGKPAKKPSKYKSILDKVNILYIKNPNGIKKLLTRIQKVIPRISKTHASYEFLVDLKHHIEGLVEEEETE